MRRGAAIVAIALVAAGPAAQAESAWERLRDRAWSWLGLAEDPDAALARLGGARALLMPTPNDFRDATVLVELRDDVRKLMREARVPWANLAIRDGAVEVRLRDASLLPAARSALAATTGPAHDAVDIREAGESVLRLVPTERAIAERLNPLLDQSVAVIRSRMEEAGFASAAVRREGAGRIVVIAPGIFHSEQLAPVISPARLEFRLIDVSMPASVALQGRVPAGSEVLHAFKTGEAYLVLKESALGGRDLADTSAAFDSNGQPCVNFRFTARGTREFGRLTQENVGRPFAIVLDNEVLSAPVIREPIVNGFGQITGNFTVEEANRLALRLRAGALPVKLAIIEWRTVGPPAKK